MLPHAEYTNTIVFQRSKLPSPPPTKTQNGSQADGSKNGIPCQHAKHTAPIALQNMGRGTHHASHFTMQSNLELTSSQRKAGISFAKSGGVWQQPRHHLDGLNEA
jgi:hypothetical protein